MTDPFIIRQDTPHEVTVTEGAQVASTRSNDPHGPQVRKVLASDEAQDATPELQAPDIPPPLVRSEAGPSGPIFERHASTDPVSLQTVTDALASDSPSQSVVFERSVQTEEALIAPDTPAPPPVADSVVFERSIQDTQPEAVGSLPDAPPAPAWVMERSLQDHHEQLPEGLAPAPASEGPSFERSSSGRFVAAPAGSLLPNNFQALPPEGLTAPDRFVAPAEGSAPVNVQLVPEPVLRPEASFAPIAPLLPPVPTAQAQAEVLETAKEMQDKVEETLGAADPVWVEMDFPARVVRLKIENDKVRAKLERLEALTRSV